MEGNGDGVEVVVESSWSVLQGSLDSCVSAIFLDPLTQDPIITSPLCASEKLVLVPPPNDSVPCEVTVKFQGRLCHVQSFYTLSTARICEIYSRSKLETDPDYICTVKGWIPHEDKFSSDEGTEMVLEAAVGMGTNEMHLISRQETDFIEENVCESVMSSVDSTIITLNPAVDVDFEKSVYSSGEDSWVDVKVNGSLTAENTCVSLTAPELDNWHLPLNMDELVHLQDQLISRPQAEDSGVNKLDGCCEEKVQFMEHIVQCNGQQEMFEAELELVDHSPWAAITIRLLSLQDKSLVEVDQMVFLVISGPVPAPASPIQSAERGANSALLTMFLPSVLQMARGVSGNSKDLQKFENSSQSCEGAQEVMDKLPAVREEKGVASLQIKVSEEGSVQQDILDLPAYVHNVATRAASKTDSPLKSEEVEQTNLQQMDANEDGSKRTLESGALPLLLGSSVVPRCNCRKSAGTKDIAIILEEFSERFDRLESLCLRMESYMHRTFEILEQRITHLEVQHSQGSGDADCVGASLQQFGTPIDASVMQNHHNNQEFSPSSMQHPSVSDLSPRSESKEEVSFTSTQSAENDYAETALKEAPNPLLTDAVDSNFAEVENQVKEAPSESRELSSGPASMVGSLAIQNKNSCASLDNAWASALSAFASSFTPVVDNENTVTCLVDEQSSGSLCDASVSNAQDCEIRREERNASKETSYSDLDSVASFTNDADFEAVNSDHGPTYEDCEQAHCDEQMRSAHAFPIETSLDIQDIFLSRHSFDLPTSTPDDSLKLLALKGMQNISNTKTAARTEVNHLADDMVFASVQVFPIVSQHAQSACPQFDVFTSAHSNSMLSEETENLAAFRGFKTGLSPVYDCSLTGMQDASFLLVNNKETQVHPHVIHTERNFSHCQEKGDSSYFGGKKQEFPYIVSDEALASTSQGAFRPVSSLFGESRFEENRGDNFCNTGAYSTVDFLSQSISSEQVRDLDTSEVQDPESLNSTSFTYCETEEDTSFLDLPEEDCSNYQDGRTCSEDSLCFSQDFDACQNDLCDEWSSRAPNIFYLHDPELTDDETISAAVDLDRKIESSDSSLEGDVSDTDFTQDLPFWHGPHSARIDQQQPTTVFPGFENLS